MAERGRYLTPAEKASELEQWSCCTTADPGVHEHVARLNAIDGVCTVQSCLGHESVRAVPHKIDSVRFVENGHVEMRLDFERTVLFLGAMGALRAVAHVEDVCITWRPGYPVCAVWFQPGAMPAVVDALVAILAPPPVDASEGAVSNEVRP